MSQENRKLFIMATNGPENPELATIPFVMATAAQASDVDVVMGFQGNGSMLADPASVRVRSKMKN